MLPWEPWQLFAWHRVFFNLRRIWPGHTFPKQIIITFGTICFWHPKECHASTSLDTYLPDKRCMFTHLSSPTWIFLAFISKNPCTIVAHWTTIAARRKLNPMPLNPYFLRNVIRRPNPTNSMKCRPWNTATKDTYVKANSSVEKKSPSFSCRVYPDIWNQAWRLPRLLGGRLHRNLRRLGIG